MGVHVVWFKRDLRIIDHEPLFEAAKSGLVLPLYVIEPDLWRQPDMSRRHFDFLAECLSELRHELSLVGQPLVIRTGEILNILHDLHQQFSINTLWSYQETWNDWTYSRDRSVKAWCKQHAIPWREPKQFGVYRAMASRDGWAAKWDKMMTRPILEKPVFSEALEIDAGYIPSALDIGLKEDSCPGRQRGGRSRGMDYLQSFLYQRGTFYQTEMSSPVTAYDACSRISPYLSFGVLSIKEVYQAAIKRRNEVRSQPSEVNKPWLNALRAFIGRLHWHCHFIQKLEDEPELEFRSMHEDMKSIRDASYPVEYLDAWCNGTTGYPLVDACMRALRETGWLNFRMRAMLMSFATYQLWIPWREPALHLARLFVDYEPGIHYCQCQMQSGATGTNAIRIYNPIKQGIEHDPDAIFIKQWIPELRNVSPARIHDVRSIHAFCPSYPSPIVDEKAARKKAADIVFQVRSRPGFEAKARKILEKHGSRKSGLNRKKAPIGARKKAKVNSRNKNQIELPF